MRVIQAATRAADVASEHVRPIIMAGASVGASVLAILQSAQELVSTLIALVSSLAALATAIMALRAVFKKKKGEE